MALKAIKNIQKRGRLPILVGGTGFYIQSVVDGIDIPEVKPNWELRKKLEKIALPKLFKRLQKLDPVRAGTIDKNNPRRVLRALEIVLATGKPVPPLLPGFSAQGGPASGWDILQIGITKTPAQLKKNINKRLLKRLERKVLINEVKKLRASGVSFKRLEEFGLEYRFVAQYLQNKITKEEMIERIQKESEHYAKRQMTWFKREPPSPEGYGGPSKKIHWIKNIKEAEKLVQKIRD
jgi:tRNA dimethylallyltransferase